MVCLLQSTQLCVSLRAGNTVAIKSMHVCIYLARIVLSERLLIRAMQEKHWKLYNENKEVGVFVRISLKPRQSTIAENLASHVYGVQTAS